MERSEYIEPERATLLSRHGAKPGEWTTVGLIARHGRQTGTPQLDGIGASVADGKVLNRRKLEAMIENITDHLEAAGLSESPTAPGMAITPLAVYRTIVARDEALTVHGYG